MSHPRGNYFMWNPGRPAAEQCEGRTFHTTQVGELAYLHSRDISYAVLCQGPDNESARYWTTRRGVEAMDCSYALMDLTAYGRQETWEDSPPGWPQQCSNTRTDGGPPGWPTRAGLAGRTPHRPVAAAGSRAL
jgi:predicted dithiol-disulfide oxidoreductase (DUF899 family)